MMQWLGVDGGGTKTAFSIFDGNMQRLGDTIELGTCHFAQVGYSGMKKILERGIIAAEKTGLLGCDWGIGFGLAGYGQELKVRRNIEEAVDLCMKDVAPAHPYELVNDVEAAHAAALGARDGIVVVAGTGSIAYGVHGEMHSRCGGWGYQIGDEGSGWWIGRETVRAFSRQSDGRSARGPLMDVVRRELNLMEDADIIGYMRDTVKGDRMKTAQLSRMAFQAASMGDKDALDIFCRAAKEDALLVRVLMQRLFPEAMASAGRNVDVSYVGGTFKAGDILLDPFERALPSCSHLQAPQYEPAAGACLLLRKRLEVNPRC